MVLLTALICFVGVIASASVTKQVQGLLRDVPPARHRACSASFVALDFFLFYVFWEVMLLPMYFLIGIWGGPRKEYAAIKFFLYTLAGSALMLLAIILLYLQLRADVPRRRQRRPAHVQPDGDDAQPPTRSSASRSWASPLTKLCWVCLFIGFAIKVPMFPFHTWLPDAHVEAPTAITVILAGVLLKMGTYGMLRINFAVLPEATAVGGRRPWRSSASSTSSTARSARWRRRI